MKRNELVEVCEYLQQYKSIASIHRVSDSTIKIVFDRDSEFYFDLSKSDSHIFKKDNLQRPKIYNAPFDVLLFKRFARSRISALYVAKNNRILRLLVESNSSYKEMQSILQFEFTGRNTNCIILDKDEVVLEALRHIDSSVSYRSIKVGEVLEALPEFEIVEKPSCIGDDIEGYLYESYARRAAIRLNNLKNQRLILLAKKISKLHTSLEGLSSEEELLSKSETYSFWGSLVLANLQKVKAYQKDLQLEDYEGNLVAITLPREARSATEAANLLFDDAKKLKKKAKSLHIERENLEEKINYLFKMQKAITDAENETKLNILMPTQKHSKKSKKATLPYESFFVEGFKIMLGKNQKGNILLLKDAKKSDIWLHVKDIPSSHVIIRTDKQSIPQSIIEFGAKLCAEFSVGSKGSYAVDYTQRRNVKTHEGANVNYVDYKTLHVEI